MLNRALKFSLGSEEHVEIHLVNNYNVMYGKYVLVLYFGSCIAVEGQEHS